MFMWNKYSTMTFGYILIKQTEFQELYSIPTLPKKSPKLQHRGGEVTLINIMNERVETYFKPISNL